jgi:hypothetical protein
MFYRWRRMEGEDRGRVWRLYGWFTALMACGSCAGAVAWAAYMMFLENGFKGNTSEDPAQVASLFVLTYSWYAAFAVIYAIEFLCLSAAKLMVLDCMSVFAAPQGTRLQTRWAAAGRVVMAAVVLGNAAGLAANAAAAVFFQKAAQAMSAASAAYAANNTEDGQRFRSLSQVELQRGGSIASVQSFCEVAVLLLIVVAFAAVGVLSARNLTSSLLIFGQALQRVSEVGRLQLSAAAATGTALRRRFVATTAFVFVAFVLRAVYSTMHAVTLQFKDTITESCPSLCDECRNEYALVLNWMSYTPEFKLLIVLVSSPLALLVALWGMTSKSTLQLMKSSQPEALEVLVPL